jgi:hypothetical protein
MATEMPSVSGQVLALGVGAANNMRSRPCKAGGLSRYCEMSEEGVHAKRRIGLLRYLLVQQRQRG